jgi:hypothetical protein
MTFSCETVNPSCGHAQLEKRAAAVELRGLLRKRRGLYNNQRSGRQSFSRPADLPPD